MQDAHRDVGISVRKPRKLSTKGAISNFTAGLAEMVGEKGIRVNAGSGSDLDAVDSIDNAPGEGGEVRLKHVDRTGRTGAYVLLASDLGSYMTGAVVPVTGGEIMI